MLESYRDGISVADVARKHGVSAPQLHSWRRAAGDGVLAMPEDDMLGLVPVVVEAGGEDGGGAPPDAPEPIVLEIEGVRIVVPPGFDCDHLRRVIAALRAASITFIWRCDRWIFAKGMRSLALKRFDVWLNHDQMQSACAPWRAAALCVSTKSRNAIVPKRLILTSATCSQQTLRSPRGSWRRRAMLRTRHWASRQNARRRPSVTKATWRTISNVLKT